MPLVLPNEGLPSLLGWMLKTTLGGAPDLVFTLWTNDIEPDQATVLADLTIATFGGFQEGILTRSGWTTPIIVDDNAVSTWGTTPIGITVTGDPQTVYGWAAYRGDTQELIVVERFDAARTPGVGETLQVLPRMQLGTYVPCP